MFLCAFMRKSQWQDSELTLFTSNCYSTFYSYCVSVKLQTLIGLMVHVPDESCMNLELWSNIYWWGKTGGLWEKHVSLPLCPPQIPQRLIWGQTQSSSVRTSQLTACAFAWLLGWLNKYEMGRTCSMHGKCLHIFL